MATPPPKDPIADLVHEVRMENKRLRAENERLKEDNDELLAEADLLAENEQLRRERNAARVLLARVSDHQGFQAFSDSLPLEVHRFVKAHCR